MLVVVVWLHVGQYLYRPLCRTAHRLFLSVAIVQKLNHYAVWVLLPLPTIRYECVGRNAQCLRYGSACA
jgi:hypothetical protein